MQRNGKYDPYLRGKQKAKELLLKKPGLGLKRQKLRRSHCKYVQRTKKKETMIN